MRRSLMNGDKSLRNFSDLMKCDSYCDCVIDELLLRALNNPRALQAAGLLGTY